MIVAVMRLSHAVRRSPRVRSYTQARCTLPPSTSPVICGRLPRDISCRHQLLGTPRGTDGEVLVARLGGAAVTDADRDAVAVQLREHYAVGRLSLDEFQDRLDAVYQAQAAHKEADA
jgi:Domain of unknown function (DUF1707)